MSQDTLYSTGSPALDAVLGGGLQAGSTTVVAGLPGTGKTILAEQFLFANAADERPALYLTTLSEPLEKTVRYLQRFSFFDPARLPGAIHYQDVGQTIRDRGIAALPELIEELVARWGAAFVVVDSFKALHDLSPEPVAFRAALFDLARVFTAAGTTALLLGEYGSAEIASLPEFAVADGVVELANRTHGVRDERTVRVHKLRGAAPLPGEHSYRITGDGLQVFPRLVGDAVRQASYRDERIPSGVPGLDVLLGGGVWRGATTLVAGPTGVGKTMLSLRFLLAGAEAGEPGVLVSFQETPASLRRVLDGFGVGAREMEARGLLRILYVPPLELDMVELFGQIQRLVGETAARRIVVDALGDLHEAALDRSRFRALIWSLVQHLRLVGVTGMLLLETRFDNALIDAAGQGEVSYLADNMLVLRYERPLPEGYDRVLEVVKTRGSGHVPGPRPFSIAADGPRLLESPLR